MVGCFSLNYNIYWGHELEAKYMYLGKNIQFVSLEQKTDMYMTGKELHTWTCLFM